MIVVFFFLSFLLSLFNVIELDEDEEYERFELCNNILIVILFRLLYVE